MAVGAERDDTGGTERGALYVLFLKKFNLDPIITSSATANVAENTTAVMNATAIDSDVPAQTLTFSIVGGADEAKFGITSGGVLSFNSAPDFEAPTDAGLDNVYDVTIQVDDGEGGIATQAIQVSVAPVNDNSPVFTSVDSTSIVENMTAVMTVTATDADVPTQTVTYSIAGGADQAKFAITSGGVLAFKTAPDFEAPTDANTDNVYVLIVQASDGVLTSLQAILVTVTPTNDLDPVFTSPAAISLPENVTTVITVTATDSDLPPQTVLFSVVGGADQAKFAITSGGSLTFNSPPNFELPTDANGDNVYVVTVQASDGVGRMSTQTVQVTITDAFEGDYNSDGTVDAADYTVWRNNVSNFVPAFSNPDGSGNGIVDQDDYKVWKSNFGNTQTMGTAAAAAIVSLEPAITPQQSMVDTALESALQQEPESLPYDRLASVVGFVFDLARPRKEKARVPQRDSETAIASYERALIALLASRPRAAPAHPAALEVELTSRNSFDRSTTGRCIDAFDLALESL